MSGKGWQILSSSSGVTFEARDTTTSNPVEMGFSGSTITIQPSTEFDVIGVNVGIGKTNPQHALDVVGNVGIGSTNSYKIGASDVLTSTSLGSGVTSSFLTSVGTLTSLTVTNDLTVNSNTLKVDSTRDKVGIGTLPTDTSEKLQVAGNVGIGSTESYKIGSSDVLTSNTLGSGVTSSVLTSVGTLTSLTVTNDLTVNSNTLKVDSTRDKVGIGTSPTDTSEKLQVAGNVGIGSTESYKIGASDVLTSNTLGSGVTSSSLTSVGTLTSLTVSGTLGNVIVDTDTLIVDTTNNVVGIGVTNPATALHVVGISGSENIIRLQGTSTSWLAFNAKENTAPGVRSGYIGWGSGVDNNGSINSEINGGSIIFNTKSSDGLTTRNFVFNSSGQVGIGTATASYRMHVANTASTNISTVRWFNQGADNQTTDLTSEPVSIYAADGSVWTTGKFVASSDGRIKENISQIDDGEALSKLRLLNPTSYNYVDKVDKTDRRVYGFIAQEVGEVLPYAVSKQREIIPNIFTTGTVNTDQPNCIILSKPHGLQTGDRVRIIKYNDTKPRGDVYTVNEIVTVNEFVVDRNCYSEGGVFVYGKEVTDFHVLDKNAIFTANVAANQELDRLIQSLYGEINNLMDRVTCLEADLRITT